MRYIIRYGQPSVAERNHARQSKGKLRIIIFAIVLFMCLIIGKSINTHDFREIMIPGDAEITSAAFNEMTDNIRHGAGIKEAFTDFCVEIIEHARIS